jgi:hypothetical protein
MQYSLFFRQRNLIFFQGKGRTSPFFSDAMASSTLGPSQIIFIPGPIYDLNIILTRRRTVHATPPAPGTFGDAVGG